MLFFWNSNQGLFINDDLIKGRYTLVTLVSDPNQGFYWSSSVYVQPNTAKQKTMGLATLSGSIYDEKIEIIAEKISFFAQHFQLQSA